MSSKVTRSTLNVGDTTAWDGSCSEYKLERSWQQHSSLSMQCDWYLKLPLPRWTEPLTVNWNNPSSCFVRLLLSQWYRTLTFGIRSEFVTEITLIRWLDFRVRKSLEWCRLGLISYSGRFGRPECWKKTGIVEAWLLMFPWARLYRKLGERPFMKYSGQ